MNLCSAAPSQSSPRHIEGKNTGSCAAKTKSAYKWGQEIQTRLLHYILYLVMKQHCYNIVAIKWLGGQTSLIENRQLSGEGHAAVEQGEAIRGAGKGTMRVPNQPGDTGDEAEP